MPLNFTGSLGRVTIWEVRGSNKEPSHFPHYQAIVISDKSGLVQCRLRGILVVFVLWCVMQANMRNSPGKRAKNTRDEEKEGT